MPDKPIITIDGSEGEGGGQILRSSLALSLITGHPLRMKRIRANREKPGLRQQHLTAVKAAQKVGNAQVKGAEVGSGALEFHPGTVAPGDYHFAIGTAGSAPLVLQTILPALLTASGPSTLTLEGGTHNQMAPPYDFLAHCFIPLIRRMGPRVDLELKRPGFYPAGGGCFTVRIDPVRELSRLDLLTRGQIRKRQARAWLSRLPSHVAERELGVVRRELGWSMEECCIENVDRPYGPGNALALEMEAEHVTEVFTAVGELGKSAENVAREAVAALKTWLEADVPVCEHLADQLLLPLAIAGGGSFRTTQPSLHATTNADVIQRFLPVTIQFEQESETVWKALVQTMAA